MKRLFFLLTLVFSTATFAQNGIIRGTVYEDETSEALFYANAQIPSTGAVALLILTGISSSN